MQGIQISNCNARSRLSRQFNALPTHGHCRALVSSRSTGATSARCRWTDCAGATVQLARPIHLAAARDGGDRPSARTPSSAPRSKRFAARSGAGPLITQVFRHQDSTDRLPTPFKSIGRDRREGRHGALACGLVDTRPSRSEPAPAIRTACACTCRRASSYRERRVRVRQPADDRAIALDFEATHAHIAKADWGTARRLELGRRARGVPAADRRGGRLAGAVAIAWLSSYPCRATLRRDGRALGVDMQAEGRPLFRADVLMWR